MKERNHLGNCTSNVCQYKVVLHLPPFVRNSNGNLEEPSMLRTYKLDASIWGIMTDVSGSKRKVWQTNQLTGGRVLSSLICAKCDQIVGDPYKLWNIGLQLAVHTKHTIIGPPRSMPSNVRKKFPLASYSCMQLIDIQCGQHFGPLSAKRTATVCENYGYIIVQKGLTVKLHFQRQRASIADNEQSV